MTFFPSGAFFFGKPFSGIGNELLFPRVSVSKFCMFLWDFCRPSWLLNCLEGKRGCFFEESAELLLFFYKQT